MDGIRKEEEEGTDLGDVPILGHTPPILLQASSGSPRESSIADPFDTVKDNFENVLDTRKIYKKVPGV